MGSLKNLTHVPMKAEEAGTDTLSIQGAFPFLEALAKEFQAQGLVKDPKTFFSVKREGRQQARPLGWKLLQRSLDPSQLPGRVGRSRMTDGRFGILSLERFQQIG